MSKEYDLYLMNHRTNVKLAYDWLRTNLPKIFRDGVDYEWQMGMNHDKSKDSEAEYAAYDAYFYGGNRSAKVVKDFRLAWLHHIHNNKHHWQHWLLINDDAKEGMITIEMPLEYVIEMICDWWAFSWASGDLMSIFDWFADHWLYLESRMHHKTAREVKDILFLMREKMEEPDGSDI